MANITNILSGENYISKDFQSIYQEYVDAVGKLNNKWLIDGEGNESDPGVILIKLLAASEDKFSYMLDRGNLENYPDTVEIESDARAIFSPVYNMRWYRSGTGSVVVQNNSGSDVTLPDYLMLCAEDNTHVYTINSAATPVPAGSIKTLPVIEGKIKTLTINGTDQITIDMFNNNRLYLDDYNVAENGIYINNYDIVNDPSGVARWTQVDNIYVQNWSAEDDIQGSGKYFEFRIDATTEKPYLQFVDDLVDKIGNGLKIRYILSNGTEGNISAGKLTKIYTSDSEMISDAYNLVFSNLLPISNGENPEDIESARRNYAKKVDICNTLVTLRDYANAIYLADGLVSNCFVCDKTNDVQTSYYIADNGNKIYKNTPIVSSGDQALITHISESTNLSNDEKDLLIDKLTADNELSTFNLKFYGLQYSDIDNGVDEDLDDATKEFLYAYNYTQSFVPINPYNVVSGQYTLLNIPDDIATYIQNIKSVNHDFAAIRNDRKICMIKNYYTLNINLLYKQRLSTEQQDTVKKNVYYALLSNLNAHSLDFGQRVTYEQVQKIIYNTDSRILAASVSGLDDVDFESKVVYWTPYTQVATSSINLPDGNGTPGSYIVNLKGSLNDDNQYQYVGQLYRYDENGEPDATGKPSAVVFSGDDRPADIPAAESGISLDVVYSEDNAWIDNYYTFAPANNDTIYISIAKPSSAIDGVTSVYEVKLTPTDSATSPQILTKYPSTPIQVQYKTSDFTVQINQKLYAVEPVSKVDSSSTSYYHCWKYDKQFYFVYYNSGESEQNPGSFVEKSVSSEILSSGQYDSNCELGQDTLRGHFQSEIYAKNVLAGNTNLFDSDFEFNPRFQDADTQLQTKIRYLQPNLSLKLTSEYQLGTAEFIQVLTPSFETVANYSYYVYVGYYSKNGKKSLAIAENQNYEILPGEFIIFFYRSDDTLPYSFTVYNYGNIVCPSKQLNLIHEDNWQSIANMFSASSPSAISKVGTATEYLQSKITNNKQLGRLMSQDSCDVKKVNIQKLDAYSFVSNTISLNGQSNVNNATYELTFNTLWKPGKYCRVLESGEQFNVFKKAGSTYTLVDTLSEGTIIILSITGQGGNWRPTLTYTANTDPNTEYAYAIEYTQSDAVEIQPYQYVMPVFGVAATTYSTSFTPSSDSSSFSTAGYSYQAPITASKVSTQLNDAQTAFKYNVESGHQYSSSDETFVAIAEYVRQQVVNTQWPSNVDDSVVMQVQYYNQSYSNGRIITDSTPLYFEIEYTITMDHEYNLTGEFESYQSNKLQYRDADATTYKTIEFSTNQTLPQLIRSALAIDIDENNSQQLLTKYIENGNESYQSLRGYSDNGSEILVIETTSNTSLTIDGETVEEYSIISSNDAIGIIGGKQRLSDLVSIYAAYEKTERDNDESIQYPEAKKPSDPTIFTLTLGGTENELPAPNIAAGVGYIIYVKNTFANTGYHLHDVCIYTKGSDNSKKYLKSLYNDKYQDVDMVSNASFTINMNDLEASTIYVTAKSDSVEVATAYWTIDAQITPYEYREDLGENYTNAIISVIKELDTAQEYVISQNETDIRNPLAAASFFNSNHLYNPFTICQMDLGDTSIG